MQGGLAKGEGRGVGSRGRENGNRQWWQGGGWWWMLGRRRRRAGPGEGTLRLGPDGRRNWVEVEEDWWWVMDDEEWWCGCEGAWRWNDAGAYGLGWTWEGLSEVWVVADRAEALGGGRWWWRLDSGGQAGAHRMVVAWPWWDWAACREFHLP